jgi:hypothetical protein
MKRNDKLIQEEIDRINRIIKNARLISESIYMEDDEYGPRNDAYESTPPEEEYAEEPQDDASALGSDFVDKIRAITLDGMKQLNNTPEDPRFQALLKIFNICNKAVEDQRGKTSRSERESDM